MSLRTNLLRTGLGLFATFGFTVTAGAQVTGAFYGSYNGSYNFNNPFPANSLICSTADVGATTTGVIINFANAATRQKVCPSNPNRLDPSYNIIGGRFTGQLWAATGGTFQFDFSADDGEVLWINGNQIFNEWNNIKGGGPGLVDLTLNAGLNSFVVDYNNSYYGGGFWRLNSLDSQVAIVTPEPSSIAMMAAGLAALAGVGMRRRRKAE